VSNTCKKNIDLKCELKLPPTHNINVGICTNLPLNVPGNTKSWIYLEHCGDCEKRLHTELSYIYQVELQLYNIAGRVVVELGHVPRRQNSMNGDLGDELHLYSIAWSISPFLV
jgi:hypothetical protein